jgi:hypothetical protein
MLSYLSLASMNLQTISVTSFMARRRQFLQRDFYGFLDVRNLGEIYPRVYVSSEAASQIYGTAGGGYPIDQVCQIIGKDVPVLQDRTSVPTLADQCLDVYDMSNEKAKKVWV